MARVADPAHDPGADRIEADATTGKLSLHPAHPATEPSHVFLRQQPVRREHAITQEPDALFARKDHALVLVDLKAQRRQESLDFQAHLMQPPLVVGEDQEVINVADVTQPEPVGHIMIEWIEVDVGEELARLVAQRQALAALDGREQVISGEPQECWLLCVAVVDDQTDQPEDVGVFDLASNQCFENLVIDRREELADVGLQDIP
jgi:hypothetical protein